MKKQFLFRSIFLAALLAASGTVKAQVNPGVPAPRPLTCTVAEGPLNPLLGKTYNYGVTVNTTEFTGSGGVTYRYWVTTEKTFLTMSGGVQTWATQTDPGATTFDVISTGTGALYNTDQAVDHIDISWNSTATETDPYFLIINVIGDNGVCDVHNTKVYKIAPLNQFTLDLANYDIDDGWKGWDDTTGEALEDSTCISDIQSITWPSAASSEEAVYDYGTNTLVWAVTAANFVDQWTPSLQLTTSGLLSLITSIRWNTAPDGSGTGGDFDISTILATNTGDGTFVDGTYTLTTATAITPNATADATATEVGPEGETVYIIMDLDHTDIASSVFVEGLTDQIFTLAIDGTLANGAHDVHYKNTDGDPLTGTADCGQEDEYENDWAKQTLSKRPTVNTNTNYPGGTDPFLTPAAQ